MYFFIHRFIWGFFVPFLAFITELALSYFARGRGITLKQSDQLQKQNISPRFPQRVKRVGFWQKKGVCF